MASVNLNRLLCIVIIYNLIGRPIRRLVPIRLKLPSLLLVISQSVMTMTILGNFITKQNYIKVMGLLNIVTLRQPKTKAIKFMAQVSLFTSHFLLFYDAKIRKKCDIVIFFCPFP